MNGRQRSAVRAILVQFGCLTAALVLAAPPVYGQPCPPLRGPAPVPFASEPPLAGAPAPPAYGPWPDAGPVDPPTPAVSIKVRVPAQVTPGQDLEYRILVENVSRADAHQVLVRNPLKPNVRFVKATPEPDQTTPELQWQLKTLRPGERKEIVLVLKPDGAGDVTNVARVRFEHGQGVTTRISRPGLQVRKTGPTRALLYDQINFHLEVTNSGRARATNVVLTETLPEGMEFFKSEPETNGPNPLVWKLGTLEAGQTRRIDYTVLLKKAGRLMSKAVVEAGGGLRQETPSTLFVGTPKLTLALTGPERRLVNRPTAYLLTVSNSGDMPAEKVELTDEVPAGIEFLGASTGGSLVRRSRPALDEVKWALGTLAPGSSRTVRVVLRAKSPGELVNVAAAGADRGLTAKATARTKFEDATGLSAEIDKAADPLDVGQDAVYVVRLINPGKMPARSVTLVVTAPEELQVSSARGPTAADQDRQTVKFAPLDMLRPGAEAEYSLYVRALKPGTAKLRVELTSAETGPTPLTWQEAVTVRAPAEPGAPPSEK